MQKKLEAEKVKTRGWSATEEIYLLNKDNAKLYSLIYNTPKMSDNKVVAKAILDLNRQLRQGLKPEIDNHNQDNPDSR